MCVQQPLAPLFGSKYDIMELQGFWRSLFLNNYGSFVRLLMVVSSRMCLLASLNSSPYLGFRNSNVTKYISFFLSSFPTLVSSMDVGFIAGFLRLKRPLLLHSSWKHAEQYGNFR